MLRSSPLPPRAAGRCASLAFGALAALAGWNATAQAHDFVILPSTATPTAAADFDLGMRVAEVFPGELVPWRTGHILELAIVDARGRTDIETPAIAGDPAQAQLRLRVPGTAVVALATDPSYITLEGPQFTAYLREEGHEAPLTARRGDKAAAPGRERYTRDVKTLLNIAGPNASVALTRVGLTLEIVPEKDLATLAPGGMLPVRVFFRNAPYSNGLLCAADAIDLAAPSGGHDTGPAAPGGGQGPYAWCGRLDGAGRISVPIPRAGWQMLRCTKMMDLHDDPKADWHSFWSSLTFQVAAPGGHS
ncbi:MAG TPA: DUF4198 domain-containing protein [Candidatus Polarisedimenticolia bacterium]|nr:DUF4198 domain-containing protein [Candidatus Polarisedimenticolia bacterium]